MAFYTQEQIEKVQPGQTWTHKDGIRELEVTAVYLDTWDGRWFADGYFTDAEKSRVFSQRFPVSDLLDNCTLS